VTFTTGHQLWTTRRVFLHHLSRQRRDRRKVTPTPAGFPEERGTARAQRICEEVTATASDEGTRAPVSEVPKPPVAPIVPASDPQPRFRNSAHRRGITEKGTAEHSVLELGIPLSRTHVRKTSFSQKHGGSALARAKSRAGARRGKERRAYFQTVERQRHAPRRSRGQVRGRGRYR
jgi:hypothetical protein